MSGATIVFCIIVVMVIAMAGLMAWVSEMAERSDTYKGVHHFGRIVRDEMRNRWLHSRCLAGHGHFCDGCCRHDECYKECEEHMKRVIDSHREMEADNGK